MCTEVLSVILFAVAGKEGGKEMETENHIHTCSFTRKQLKVLQDGCAWTMGKLFND